MKKTKPFRIISLIAFIAFVLVLNSCKKADIKPPNNNSAETARAAAIQAIKAKYGNVSAGIIINVNRDAKDLFYRDAATGNMIKVDKNNTGRGPLCNYNCNNTNNPANLHLVYTLSYIQRNYECESANKSNLNVSWTISVPFTPLTTYNGNSSNGTLKVTDPGGTLHTYSGLSITIRTIGADPGCAANTLYEISYQATQVPDSYFGSGMTMDASLSLYNNCALVNNLVTTGDVAGPDFTLYPHLPCSRVDKVWVIPPGGGSTYAQAFGNYNICFYPTGFTPIDYHQVEYRLVNNGSGSLQWDDQTTAIHWARPVGSGSDQPTVNPYTGSSTLLQITASSGTWLVRYRNVKTSVCDIIDTNNPGADWGDHFYWVVEVLTT